MSMTYKECYDYAVSEFANAGNEDARFDASTLIQFVFDLDKGELLMCADQTPHEPDVATFKKLVAKRVSGVPIQYIIGEWDFFDYSFYVGEGVLIPRPETEILVSEAINHLEKSCLGSSEQSTEKPTGKPVVFDLCAGSGCVGISIAKQVPNADVYAFEKSPETSKYLLKNIARNSVDNVTYIHSDVITGEMFDAFQSEPPEFADVIVSNPPYIRSEEIAKLQREVLKEPVMALDGGDDGLIFYRAIAERFISRLKSGGLLLVECGEDQADDIEQIFSICGVKTFKICDFAGIYRVVGAKKR